MAEELVDLSEDEYFDAELLGNFNLTKLFSPDPNVSITDESFLNTAFASQKNIPSQPIGTTSFESSVTNYLKSYNGKLAIGSQNINSLVNKFNDIVFILNNQLLDIFVLNETKLDEHVDSSIFEHQFYAMLRRVEMNQSALL